MYRMEERNDLEQKLMTPIQGKVIDTYARGTTALYYGEVPLDGGCYIDVNKTTSNTVIIKEGIPGMEGTLNTYIHHDRGPGRMV